MILSNKDSLFPDAISPIDEMAAYEALWKTRVSFKQIADLFRKHSGSIPSDFVKKEDIFHMRNFIFQEMKNKGINDYGIIINSTLDYPERLRDARNPIEAFYYRGNWEIIEHPKRIAIVGSRNPSENGLRRTARLVKLLVKENFTIVSGLAKGIDTMAHKTAIECGGRTVAVIGTPITEYYPPENRGLQDKIAKEYLLISQIPLWKYSQQDYRANRSYFPERNVTMSALTQATVIIEASETSGTLIQARAALAQNRKVFILDNCFNNPNITWPEKFLKKGAIRVKEFSDIINNLDG
ncbi:TPA: DNA-protecting protein DprA [Pasteurella multocida]|uniref:DNA-processing protein DprA n=1 Tax=Pasteurella multocida TaxID=747 RepID=UPI0028DF9424|nr:DNA-processing protein DprA [Pasteurella multocida]MEB3484069.1 DNA-processing protein DprA [Pasteurella multocida]MEB3495114.1 DNA-processing protein DprA [Pasteurella multocida]HDR0967497.1 DNA-protecting protein DprA [Pasteurella multocida]HDR0970274.1 DNA-protecting protein DprA [Pasteurella multocida]HDR0994637.1 DNA-protecting protein DprA [Pasteurella multocida]